MEIRQTIKEMYQKYQYWQAPRCGNCETKLIDLGKRTVVYEDKDIRNPIKISVSAKGSLRFEEWLLGIGDGIACKKWTVNWCGECKPEVDSLIPAKRRGV